jgi:hypothetical protein
VVQAEQLAPSGSVIQVETHGVGCSAAAAPPQQLLLPDQKRLGCLVCIGNDSWRSGAAATANPKWFKLNHLDQGVQWFKLNHMGLAAPPRQLSLPNQKSHGCRNHFENEPVCG